MIAIDDPLVAPPPPEVPLKNAPLVRVIAQVRFPLVVALEHRDSVAPFQQSVAAKYPVLRQEQTQVVLLGPAGGAPASVQTVWRFSDVEGRWRVSLAPDFVALETTSYTSRADFLARLREVVEALDRHFQPKLVDRLGVRYVDRIQGSAVNEIAKLVRPEVGGIAGTAANAHALHTLSESMFELQGARVLARWGSLPAGSTVDAAAVEPINEPSWILDLDMFTTTPAPFSIDRVIEDATRFTGRIYTFFRWAVTEEFLRRYGGTV